MSEPVHKTNLFDKKVKDPHLHCVGQVPQQYAHLTNTVQVGILNLFQTRLKKHIDTVEGMRISVTARQAIR